VFTTHNTTHKTRDSLPADMKLGHEPYAYDQWNLWPKTVYIM